MVAILGAVVELIGLWFICITTVVMGYYILSLIHPDKSPVVPLMLYLGVGYVVGKLYMSVFQLAVDTCLQCFMIVVDMDSEEDLDFVPKALQSLLPNKGGGWISSLFGLGKKQKDDDKDTEKK